MCYVVYPVTEVDKNNVIDAIRRFAWDAEIYGRFDRCTNRLIVCFDDGKLLSDETQDSLAIRLRKDLYPLRANDMPTGYSFTINSVEQE